MLETFDYLKSNKIIISFLSMFKDFFLFAIKFIYCLVTKTGLLTISALFNLCLGLCKYRLVKEKSVNHHYIGWSLYAGSFAYIIYSFFRLIYPDPSQSSLSKVIILALIAFFDLMFAVYGIVDARVDDNRIREMMKTMNLANAFIALSICMRALLIYQDQPFHDFLIALSGIICGMLALQVSLYILKRK